MTLRERQWLFMQNVAKLIAEIDRLGYTASFGETWRAPEQAAINAFRGTGIKNSLHTQRLAIDINLFKDGVFLTDGTGHKELGQYWESLHPLNKNGRNFPKPDSNHYQMSDK